MKQNRNLSWTEIDDLENNARGMFVGGLLTDLDSKLIATLVEDPSETDVARVQDFLESMGAKRISSGSVSVEEMKERIVFLLETNARIASIAATSIESLPNQTVKSLYSKLMYVYSGLNPTDKSETRRHARRPKKTPHAAQ